VLTEETLVFLLIVLDYHTKTRTLLDLATTILECVKPAASNSGDRFLELQDIMTGPFFAREWLAPMTQLFKTFLTEGQVALIVAAFNNAVLQCGENLLLSGQEEWISNEDADLWSTTFYIVVNLYSQVLPSFPLSLLAPQSSLEVKAQIVDTFTRGAKLDAPGASRYHIRQLVVAAALCCRHSLQCPTILHSLVAPGREEINALHPYFAGQYDIQPDNLGLLSFELVFNFTSSKDDSFKLP
jgi:hypothetical protein